MLGGWRAVSGWRIHRGWRASRFLGSRWGVGGRELRGGLRRLRGDRWGRGVGVCGKGLLIDGGGWGLSDLGGILLVFL